MKWHYDPPMSISSLRHHFLSYGSEQLLELHDHKNQGLEIVYLERGALRWHVDHREENLLPNSVFYTLPWQLHGSLEEYDPGHRIHWLTFKLDQLYDKPSSKIAFPKELDFSSDEQEWLSNILVNSSKHTFLASEWIGPLIQKTVLELEKPDQLSDQYLKGLMHCIIIELCRIIKKENAPSTSEGLTKNMVKDFLVALEHRCSEDWTLDKMAETCNLKRTQFALIVKEITGEPPLRYLIRLRVNKSRKLLRDSSLSVTKIAMLCGFSNSQYFAKIFKEFTNRKPLEYRRIAPYAPQDFGNFISEEDEIKRLIALKRTSK